MKRRSFLQITAVGFASSLVPAFARQSLTSPWFEISLAQWSLHRSIRKGVLDNLGFPEFAKREFGIHAVEYVNRFFNDKSSDQAYLAELRQRCDDLGVRSVLIMCDGLGHIGAETEEQRIQTVENHKSWVEAAQFLGCHSIRVNAHGHGNRQESAERVVDGLSKLSEFARDFKINVIVENHGGLSSDGQWLKEVLTRVGMENCGSLPDFGNFHQYDRYQGIEDLMPFAKGVSAKSHRFDEAGNEVRTDYLRAMRLVKDAGYRGYVGIEYEGGQLSEIEGIKLTKALLERVRSELG